MCIYLCEVLYVYTVSVCFAISPGINFATWVPGTMGTSVRGSRKRRVGGDNTRVARVCVKRKEKEMRKRESVFLIF